MTQLATFDLVRGLLHQVIAAQPGKETPVPDLILHLPHACRLQLARAPPGILK